MPVGGLRPNRSILQDGPHGLVRMASKSLSAEDIGWKAYGLASLPPEWVPNFFVVDATAITCDDTNLQTWVRDALLKAVISPGRVVVRSSGAAETMRNRGRLVSETCSTEQIVATIRKLSSMISDPSVGKVHWIVQADVRPVRRGHLSNERHLSYENRDWVAEVELQGDRLGYASTIAIRPWRDGAGLPDLDLSCGSEPQITLRLRKVAKWATTYTSRLHFEWVWDGATVWLERVNTT